VDKKYEPTSAHSQKTSHDSLNKKTQTTPAQQELLTFVQHMSLTTACSAAGRGLLYLLCMQNCMRMQFASNNHVLKTRHYERGTE
jgi:hypothetical protein